MTDAIEEDCPVCDSSDSAKAQFATAKAAEHVLEKARSNDKHQQWIDGHTENGTLSEIRAALQNESPPR